MIIKIYRYILITVGLSLIIFGCDDIQPNDIIQPGSNQTENGQTPDTQPPTMVSNQPDNAEATFNANLLPILTAKCAFAGCHIAGGPQNIDLSSYQAFIKGGDGGPVFIAGDAQGSSIIDEIVSGRMPIGGTKLSDAEIQVFTDWINNQAPTMNTPNNQPPEPQTPLPVDGIVSYDQHLQPILTARCAYAGCHDANGYDDLDFRTYESFIRGDDEGESVFIPGNARSSDIIEEMVSGRMPPAGHGPPLTAAQIQLFRDWINQQDRSDFPNLRFDDDDDDDYDDDDYDDDDYDDDDYDDDDDDDDDDD